MSMHQVDIHNAQTNLPDLIDAAVKGELVIITKDGKSAVKLVPVAKNKTCRKPGSAKGMIIMSEDFDEPLEDFKGYL